MSPPPVAPSYLEAHVTTTPDLFNAHAEGNEHEEVSEGLPPGAVPMPMAGHGQPQYHPSLFNTTVKRSTRFQTHIPAHEVMETFARVLENCRLQALVTPIGRLGHIIPNWENYRIEVRASNNSPMLFALQILKLGPSNTSASIAFSPAMSSSWNGGIGHDGVSRVDLNVVEFIRGHCEIFPFKRFYSWLRQEVGEIVKREASFQYLDQASSPMVDSTLMRNYEHILGPGPSGLGGGAWAGSGQGSSGWGI
jgi:hypothetical protein